MGNTSGAASSLNDLPLSPHEPEYSDPEATREQWQAIYRTVKHDPVKELRRAAAEVAKLPPSTPVEVYMADRGTCGAGGQEINPTIKLGDPPRRYRNSDIFKWLTMRFTSALKLIQDETTMYDLSVANINLTGDGLAGFGTLVFKNVNVSVVQLAMIAEHMASMKTLAAEFYAKNKTARVHAVLGTGLVIDGGVVLFEHIILASDARTAIVRNTGLRGKSTAGVAALALAMMADSVEATLASEAKAKLEFKAETKKDEEKKSVPTAGLPVTGTATPKARRLAAAKVTAVAAMEKRAKKK